MHDFQRLHVWQLSRELFVEISELTRSFPSVDRGVVASQLRRAALSISANIAEGCGKSSAKETIRFFQIAAGSVTEAQSHLLVSSDMRYIPRAESERLVAKATSIRNMLYRLTKSIEVRAASTSGG